MPSQAQSPDLLLDVSVVRVPASDTDHDLHGLVVQLHNDLAPLRRRAPLTRQLRRILGPIRSRCHIVDEVRRRLELGEAGVLRVPAGTDDGCVPRGPAIIEFEDAGTLCFWCPPIGHRTIAIKPFARSRIMELAEGLDALNATARRARERREAASKRRRAAARSI